jgi:gliding motility-associated-like protein
VFNGKTYNRTGTYADTIKRCFPQCDSIINLKLTVIDAFKTNKDTVICSGSTVRIGNKTYNQTGNYIDTLKTRTNCDSIITLKLTVTPIVRLAQSFTICDIESIKVGNKSYNLTGSYRDTFTTADNCTSIITTTLTVNQTYTSGQSVSICPNASYKIGVNTYTQEGVYRDVLKTINGCDSIVTTTLTIRDAFSRTQKIKLCAGETFRVGANIYSQTGIYSDTFRVVQGCDSVITTDLTINAVYAQNQSFSICSGDFVKVGAKMYTQTGVYRDTLKTTNGCDSILITNLAVLPPLSINQSFSICEGDFIQVGTKNYTQTGIYKDTLKTRTNCDSLVTTNLVVNRKYARSQDVAICPSSSYKINNRTYTQAGVYRDTFQTAASCDSIITTTLAIQSTLLRTQNINLCAGQVFSLNNKTYSQTGIYRDSFRTSQGCDSVVVTDLTINTVVSKSQNFTFCQGDLVTVGTKTYKQTGIYRDTLRTINGCDSILISNVMVLPPLSIAQNLSICAGDFVRIGTKTYNLTGVYKDTLKARINCDSIVTTNLVVNKNFNRNQSVSICPNSFYRINNRTYTQAGVYRDTLKTITNCDSIIVTTLAILPPLSIAQNLSICAGDFVKIGVKTYNQAGIYRDTLKTIDNCDSILVTTLIIKPERKRLIDSTICEGKTLIVNGKKYQKAGIFGDTIRLSGQCDSVLSIALKIKPYPVTAKKIVLCANDSALVNGRLFTKIGVFRDTVASAIACDEVTEWTVEKTTLRLNMGISPEIGLGDSVELAPMVSGAQSVLWAWTANKSLSCAACSNPIAKPTKTTIFTLIVRDTATNCTIKDGIKVFVKPCENIFLPTVFSPNNDGANDYFSVFAADCVRKVVKLQLFNRWGVMVFSNTNFLPNNERNGWDGRMNNAQLPPDVYVYAIELELGDGTTRRLSGDVTLVR